MKNEKNVSKELWLAQELLICMTYVIYICIANLAQHSVSLQSIFQYLEITNHGPLQL